MSENTTVAEHEKSAEEITRGSKSNLALAFIALPREVRRDIFVFYGFCRVVDDLADEPGLDREQRLAALARWKQSLSAPAAGEPPLAAQVRDLISRRSLSIEHFTEIILGCEMDVEGAVYETWEDLRIYCHRVASVVGLVSIRIFGCHDPAAETYAKELGLALQLTNIIRDVGQDYEANRRVYLPRAEMDRFDCEIANIAEGRESEPLRRLLEFQANRALGFFQSALDARPESDRRALVAAEIMRLVYFRLLSKMRRGGFRVLHHRYRLSRWEKLWCVLRGRLGI
jgi:phytoene synthase